MRILVTGGAGFIGSDFVRMALTSRLPGVEPSELVVLDALTYAGNLANLDPVAADPRLRVVEGDILDDELVDGLVGAADAVVHFAAESNDEVYGSIATGSWPETHALEPNSPYAASKASSDLIARAYARTHGLDVRV